MTTSKMSKSRTPGTDNLFESGGHSRRQILALAGSAVLAWVARPMRAFAKEEPDHDDSHVCFSLEACRHGER